MSSLWRLHEHLHFPTTGHILTFLGFYLHISMLVQLNFQTFAVHDYRAIKTMSFLIVLFEQVFTSSAVRVYIVRIARWN